MGMTPVPYDPNYDPVLEERKRVGRSGGNPLTTNDLSQVPFFGAAVDATIAPGGFLNPAPAGHVEPQVTPAAVSDAPSPRQMPQPNPSGGDFTFNPSMSFQSPGLNPAQQETVPDGTRLTTTINGGHGLSATQFNDRPGLAGQAWLDDQRADPKNAWHDESMGKWTGSSDEGGFSPERVYGDIGDHDPVPNDPGMGDSGDGILFSGSHTQADDEGRLRLGQFRNMIAAQEREAADPFAEQRLKGQYDVLKAVAPAQINAQSDKDVAALQGNNALNVEGLRGANAVGKEEAQYGSYDKLILDQYQQRREEMLTNAQRTGASPEQIQRADEKLINDAIQAKLKIRELGVGGRPNPLEAAFGNPTGVQVPRPNPAQ